MYNDKNDNSYLIFRQRNVVVSTSIAEKKFKRYKKNILWGSNYLKSQSSLSPSLNPAQKHY